MIAVVVYFFADRSRPPTLSDWGSFISGVASAIALVWLVLGFRQQAERLTVQQRELAASVHALNQQAKATEEALGIAAAGNERAEWLLRMRQPVFRNAGVHIESPRQSPEPVS